MRIKGVLKRDTQGSVAAFRSNLLLAVVSVIGIVPLQAHATDSPDNPTSMAPVAQYMMDKTAEIALARSAAPKEISDNATIMTLGKDGYETTVKGGNGFTCLVFRSWGNDFDAPDFWDPRDLTPQCWNAAAVSWLPEFVERTKWVLAGVSKDEMVARTKQAWASHEYSLPRTGSVAYMMSKDQCIHAPPPCNWYPHIMWFLATADPRQQWGQDLHGVPVYSGVSKTDPVTTLMVVVPKWSDGTAGPYAPPAEHKH